MINVYPDTRTDEIRRRLATGADSLEQMLSLAAEMGQNRAFEKPGSPYLEDYFDFQFGGDLWRLTLTMQRVGNRRQTNRSSPVPGTMAGLEMKEGNNDRTADPQRPRSRPRRHGQAAGRRLRRARHHRIH